MKTGFDFKKIHLLHSLSAKTLNALKDAVVYKKYTKGSCIFEEGQRPTGLYFLISGEVGLYKTMKDGSEVLLHSICPNQTFGEVSLLAGIPYNDFSRAEKPIELYFLSKENFDNLIKKDPNAAISISLSLTHKLTELRQRIIHERNKTTIAVFYNEGNQKEKSWLAMETALSIKDQTGKKVLLIDLLSQAENLESILKKKFDYDFIIINLPPKKDSISAAIILQSDFLINLSKKKLDYFNKLYDKNIRIENIDLNNERRLDRMDWFIGHLARVLARRTVGLALGSGSVGGFAHIGVIKYLQEKKIPIDLIVGCSAGALYGSFFASKGDLNQLIKAVKQGVIKGSKIFEFGWSLEGYSKGKFFENLVKKELGNIKIQDLKIPLKIVSTNLKNKKIHIFDNGNLWNALRSSIAVPIIFTPMKIGNNLFIDGNISSPLPVEVLKSNNINITIGVYASTQKSINKNPKNFVDVYLKSRSLQNDNLAFKSAILANYFINPDISKYKVFEHSKYRELINIGYLKAKEILKNLKL